VAHTDRNAILFERIKTVISMMARGPQQQTGQASGKAGESDNEDNEGGVGIKENKIVMTELMGQLLRHSKDQQMLKAYTDCFLLLTKTYYQSTNPSLQKFLVFTFKELLKTYLGGRLNSAAINVRFFQSVFEQNPGFGWGLAKVLIKCIAETKTKEEKKDDDDELIKTADKKKQKKDSEDGEGSRSNHQRLQAVELLGHLIKEGN
jgi:hypothetical protein